MAQGFKKEPKMETTEPKVELKLKKGGMVESAAEHKSEMKKLGKVEKELKSHEGKKASVAHAGLKKGGAAKKADGGRMRAPSMVEKTTTVRARPAGAMPPVPMRAAAPMARRAPMMGGAPAAPSGAAVLERLAAPPVPGGMKKGGTTHGTSKSTTGGIELSGYKRGGRAMGGKVETDKRIKKVVEDRTVQNKKDGGSVKPFVQTKVVEAKGHKGGNKTGGVDKTSEFKCGGGVRKYAAGGRVEGFANTKVDTFEGHKAMSKTGGVAGFKAGGRMKGC